jgi:hypothetical protein
MIRPMCLGIPVNHSIYRDDAAAISTVVLVFGLDESCEHCCDISTFLRAVNNNLIGMCEGVCESTVALECTALKTCSKCHITKPVGEFYKNNGNMDGLCYYCKECDAKTRKAHCEKNKARKNVVIPESKTCPGCKTVKIGLDFHKSRSNKDGLNYYCKECDAKSTKALREKNRARAIVVVPEFKTCPICKIEKSNSCFHKANGNIDGLQLYCKGCFLDRQRKLKYGASPEWIKATLEAQGGSCAICKFIPGTGDRGLDLDHVHGGGPRGFLHGKCNRGLGHFKDSVELIRKAIDYLNGSTTGIIYKVHLDKAIKNKILVSQGYVCRICSVDLHNKKVCIDHDHDTMMIRGALCNGCNCGLGCFDDSVILLTNAIGYLQKYETDSNL